MTRCLISVLATQRAEGVETEAQLAFLDQNGCRAYQGYLFARPIPIDELMDKIPG
jgi:EAL domain-containing protein (putative c-di-GMP-specific phosphodiesterase class I)